MIRRTRWAASAAAALLLAVAACGGSHAPPGPGPVSARAIARGAVETLESAWLVGSEACRGVAKNQQDEALARKCAAVFLPARSILLAAAAGVDSWTDADEKNVPCALADLVIALDKADVLLVSLGVQVPNEVSQGLELAAALAPQCVRPDAGSPTTPEAGE